MGRIVQDITIFILIFHIILVQRRVVFLQNLCAGAGPTWCRHLVEQEGDGDCVDLRVPNFVKKFLYCKRLQIERNGRKLGLLNC